MESPPRTNRATSAAQSAESQSGVSEYHLPRKIVLSEFARTSTPGTNSPCCCPFGPSLWTNGDVNRSPTAAAVAPMMTYFPRNADAGTLPSRTSEKLKVCDANEPAGPTYSMGTQLAVKRCVLRGWLDSISIVRVSVLTGNVRPPTLTVPGSS